MRPLTAVAEDTYTDALDDLKADYSFDTSQWEQMENDYSLQLITIAESVNNELFVYVYQPYGYSEEYYATYIRLSTTIDESIMPRDHKLIYLNHNGVFYKYKVDDYTVTQDSVRYYVVVQLMRSFISHYDQQADYDNTISAVPYNVSRQYKFTTVNGKTSISALDIETIVITDKLVGHVRHQTEQLFQIKTNYMHFVAFRCDHDIDDLLEADVSFVTQRYHKNVLTGYDYGTPDENVITLYAENEHEVKYGFGNTQKAVWNEIQSVDDFISSNDINSIYSTALVNVYQAEKLTEQAKNDLRNMDWVLQFYQVDETTLRQIFGPAAGLTTDHNGVNVTDVTILRLKFVTNGLEYNLGVVDNKQTGSDKPSNESKVVVTPAEGSGWLWSLIGIALLVLLVVVLWPAVPYIAKFLIWIIALPFKAIAALFRGISNYNRNHPKREKPKKEKRVKLKKAKTDEEVVDEYWQDMKKRKAKENCESEKVDVKTLRQQLKSGERTFPLTRAEDEALGNDRDILYDYVADNDIKPTKAAEKKAQKVIKDRKRWEKYLKRKAKRVDMDKLKKTVYSYGLDEKDLSEVERYAVNRDEELAMYFAYKDQDPIYEDFDDYYY